MALVPLDRPEAARKDLRMQQEFSSLKAEEELARIVCMPPSTSLHAVVGSHLCAPMLSVQQAAFFG